MAVTNKRAICVAENEPLLLEEKPIHITPEKGLIVKTHYAGVCQSDVHVWEGKMKRLKFPVLLGHEISGEIYAIGEKVERDDVKVGDRVACYSWLGCKDCVICKNGDQRMCRTGDPQSIGLSHNEGGYQQYVAIQNANDVLTLPDDFPMDIAAIVGCSGLTSYNALLSIKEVIEDAVRLEGSASLLVIGVGGLGQWGVTLAKALLPQQCTVTCADVSDDRVALGMRSGADQGVVWSLTASDAEVDARTTAACPGGFHAVVDYVSNTTTTGRGFKYLTKGGHLAMAGLYGGTAQDIPIVPAVVKGITIHGVMTGSFAQLKVLFRIVHSDKLRPPPITKIRLEDAYEYLQRLRARTVDGRAVIDFC